MIVAQVINITSIIGKIFNRKLRYLKMMTSSQGHLVEEVLAVEEVTLDLRAMEQALTGQVFDP